MQGAVCIEKTTTPRSDAVITPGKALVVLSILCRLVKRMLKALRSSEFSVPKGKAAVYVGQKDGEFQRVLVPVAYLNHPLFKDLLKESENEYGFVYSGGVAIPCGIAYFEGVLWRIKKGSSEAWGYRGRLK